MPKNKSMTIGIDLGTTNSLVSIIQDGKPLIIPNERGSRMTPSVVALKEDKKALVGVLARNQASMNSEITVSNVKLSMGSDAGFHIRDRYYTPSEISTIILRKLKKVAENYLGREARNAVITVPAYFNDNQRQATLRAAKMADLHVLRLLNEPTAAALAYGFNKKEEGRLLVLDLGGGTLDITLLEYMDKVFRVQGVGGSTSIGGVNFDREIIKYILKDFKAAHSIDLSRDRVAYQQLVINSEKAKIDLSTVKETQIMVPYITTTPEGPVHLNSTIKRETFETLIAPILKEIRALVLKTFDYAGLSPSWVDSIILVGGSTRVPAIEKLIREIMATDGKGKIVSPAMDALRKDFNPDEAVALGAGILAGVLDGSMPDMEFHDITSHNLGIEDDAGNFANVLPRGREYPTRVSRLFTTIRDNQEDVAIHVLQNGDREGEEALVSLGLFHLKNIAPDKAGAPNIDVIFSIDRDGVLHVSAVNLDTGEAGEITIDGPEKIKETEIEERRGREVEII